MKFWRNKKDREIKVTVDNVKVINRESLLLNFIFDSRLSEAQQLAAILGLPMLSEEEMAEAESESEVRALRLSPILPIIDYLSSSLSNSIVEYFSTVAEEGLNEEETFLMEEVIGRVCLASTMASISQLEDLGIISYEYGV